MYWAIAVAVFLVLLLVGRATSRFWLEAIAKPAASLAFVAVALERGAADSTVGRLVLAGLVLSVAGDVFLMSKAKRWFLLGLAVFLLAHVMYGVAFTFRGVNHRHVGVILAALFGVATMVWRWLGPHVKGGMRGPVLAYIAVISWMLATAIETARYTETWLLAVGALAFYLSDLFVARERFVAKGFVNRLIGLPLYYGGQVLIAWYWVR